MSNWFPIFLLPFVTLAIPMIYVAFDLIGMSRQHSAFATSKSSTDHPDVEGMNVSVATSDRSTLIGFVRNL